MKHVRSISQTPKTAQQTSTGQILTLVASILGVVGAALLEKEAAENAVDA